MNIIVRPSDHDLCYCRPDTTWERENRDYYCPDCLETLEWTPVIFARISKAGKCIGNKFIGRYYDAINFGALIYTGTEEIAFTSCTDHTSILPFPMYNPVVMENGENLYEVCKNNEVIFSTSNFQKSIIEIRQKLEESICLASQLTSLRIGDFVVVELAPRTQLAERENGEASLSLRFCGNEIFSNRIIF